jgi:hypothetical protein
MSWPVDFTSAISFLTTEPVSLGRVIGGDRFLPENEEDVTLLEQLGTDAAFQGISLTFSTRTFAARITAQNIEAVLPRRTGMRIYADALRTSFDVAQFRELWRVLESAFGATSNALMELLESYPPAQHMGFDRSELRQLLVLRGRASHAQSKTGIRELTLVERACSTHLPRLRCLAQRVILTKADWGRPSRDVDELSPLRAYIGTTGELKLIAPQIPTADHDDVKASWRDE